MPVPVRHGVQQRDVAACPCKHIGRLPPTNGSMSPEWRVALVAAVEAWCAHSPGKPFDVAWLSWPFVTPEMLSWVVFFAVRLSLRRRIWFEDDGGTFGVVWRACVSGAP